MKNVVFNDGIRRCPYCNKDLSNGTYQYVCKHVRRCSQKINPYRYSDRPPGRPTNMERVEILKKRDEEKDWE